MHLCVSAVPKKQLPGLKVPSFWQSCPAGQLSLAIMGLFMDCCILDKPFFGGNGLDLAIIGVSMFLLYPYQTLSASV